MSQHTQTFRPCAVIPVYNHHLSVARICDALLASGLPVVLVNDGSNAECSRQITAIAESREQVELISHSQNSGKGAAVKTGLQTAKRLGYTHALQIDADGQHDLADLNRFIALAQQQPSALILGYPKYDASVPRHRYYGRYLTHVWIWINTLSTSVRDSMCGFRVYPVTPSCELIERSRLGNHMDFDSEFVVHWFWSGASIGQLSTSVTYPEDGLSHFRPWSDNVLISKMHAKLFFGMLWRIPKLLRQANKAQFN